MINPTVRQLQQRLQTLDDKVSAMTRRERLILLVTLLAAIYGLWDYAFFQPSLKAQKRLTSGISETRVKINTLETTIQELSATALIDPNQKNRERLAQLEKQLAALDQRLDKLSSELITPQQMNVLLQELLAGHEGIKLVSAQNLAAEPLLHYDSGEDTSAAPSVYKHTLEVELEGEFFPLLAYLHELEGSAMRYYWESLDYRVTEYPLARVRLRLVTLSFKEAWIGV